jgi:hypothetical protein
LVSPVSKNSHTTGDEKILSNFSKPDNFFEKN